MSWQDELRQLDEDLAVGKVSAEEYRSRRDAVLAQTAGPPSGPTPIQQQPAPQSGPQSGQPPQQQSQQPPQQPQPAPPPMWSPGPQPQFPAYPPQGQRPPDRPGERTEFIQSVPLPSNNSANNSANNAEATQIVPQVGPGQDGSERTQVVTGFSGRPAGPGGWSTQPPPANTDAPWGTGPEFPPLSSLRQNEPWYAQGPEVFDRRGGSRGKIIAIAGVAVLVVLVVVALLVFKPFSGTNPAQPSADQATTTHPPTTKPTPTGPIARIPGSTAPNAVRTFADVPSLNFLSSEEVTAIQGGNPTTTYFSDTQDGHERVLILVVKTSGAAAANSIATQLAQLQIKYEMSARTGGPVGVAIQTIDTVPGGPLRRAEYASGRYVLRIQVQGPDATGVDQELTSVLDAQLAKLPAND